MTAISSAIESPAVIPFHQSGGTLQGGRTRAPNCSQLVKATGVLALMLSGSVQAAGTRSAFMQGRELQDSGHVHPQPYDYDSICKSGILDSYVQGLNYEDCIEQEKETINRIRQGTKANYTERCYKVSGYVTAGLSGLGMMSLCLGEAGAIPGISSLILGSGSLLATTVCGLWNSNIEGRLKDSRDVAEKCCRFFPKKEDAIALSEQLIPVDNSTAPAPNSP